jgi:hypothetical protein
MDGDATFKPVLHLVFAPIASEWLAPSVRQQLGMKVIPENGLVLEELVSKNTQKRQEDQPTVGHVHSTSGAADVSGHVLFVGLLVLSSHTISAKNNPCQSDLLSF